MKICFIVGSFPYMDCGVGDYTSMIAKALANLENEVSVITSKKANNEAKDVHIYNIIDKFNYKSIDKIIHKLKEINPDVVNIQYPSHGFYNRKITSILLPIEIKRKLKNVKLVETVHEYPKYSWKGKCVYWINYKIMDKTIFVEENYKELIKKDFKKVYKKMNISCIPIGANISKSKLSENEKEKLKEKLGLENKKIISYFGFARPSKGIENLFKAVSLIDDENVKLLYIGDLKENNDYQKKLLYLMDELKIKDNVIMTGYVPKSEKVADYLYISDICVLPFTEGVRSRYSSFLAACNQQIKIITTAMNDKLDEEGIYYIKPNDSKLLAEKIEDVIYNTDIKSNKKIKDWDEIAKQYIIAYNEIK